jgi:GNAT superfamily N-acetyltransferase
MRRHGCRDDGGIAGGDAGLELAATGSPSRRRRRGRGRRPSRGARAARSAASVHAPEGAAADSSRRGIVHAREWAAPPPARQALDDPHGRAAWHRAMEMRPLTAADLPRAAALSYLIGWNQVERDWALFLARGEGRALDDGQEALAATAAVIRYGPDLAWISMVLVRPDMRRRGHATALMRWAVDALAGTRCAALDATPAGREVYRRLGFRDLWGFARWALPAPCRRAQACAVARATGPRCWRSTPPPSARRARRCCAISRRASRRAFVADGRQRLRAARDGARGPQIGPVVARDDATAAR